MNDVLSKCIEELTKDNPSVPYVRGMLETLLAMNNPKMEFNPPKIVVGKASLGMQTHSEIPPPRTSIAEVMKAVGD